MPRPSRIAPPLLPPNLGPVLEFMRALWALDHALTARHRDIGGRFGVTGAQRLAIRIVGQTPGISAGAVAHVLHVHPSTLTPTLQVLVERGLVRRELDPLDRRRAILRLSRHGERVDAASAALVDLKVRRALSRLTGSEIFAARRVLNAVAAAVGGEVDEGAAIIPAARSGPAPRGSTIPASALTIRAERPKPARRPAVAAPAETRPRAAAPPRPSSEDPARPARRRAASAR